MISLEHYQGVARQAGIVPAMRDIWDLRDRGMAEGGLSEAMAEQALAAGDYDSQARHLRRAAAYFETVSLLRRVELDLAAWADSEGIAG